MPEEVKNVPSEVKNVSTEERNVSAVPPPTRSLVQLVVFVLDGSKSMDWSINNKSKSNMVKETLRSIVRYFKDEEHWKKETDTRGPGENIFVQVIAFDTEVVKYFDDFVRMIELPEDAVLSPTEKIRKTLKRTNKGTTISVGLRSAWDSIGDFIRKRELDINRIYRPTIILLSDGCTNKSDRQPLLELSEELLKLYQIFVIEFGESGQQPETADFHRQSCPEILAKVASPLDPGLLQKIKRVGQRVDSVVKVEELFQGNRGYIRTLNEKHLRVIFITMTTLAMVKK
ncbi:MAG: vWA domain-containing protein [Candidatus Atabeyarchaeum deiterrae]